MTELVQYDDIFGRDQNGNGAEGRGVSAAEGQRSLGLLPLSQRSFQAEVRRLGTADEAGRAGANPESVYRRNGGGAQSRVIGEAEVIIGRKVKETLSVKMNGGGLTRRDLTELSIKRFSTQRVQLVAE